MDRFNDSVDFDQFHRVEVPTMLASGLGTGSARNLGSQTKATSLAFRLSDGRAYTYRVRGPTLEVVPGDGDAELVAELAPDAFADLVREVWSVFGLLYGGRVTMRRGDFGDVARWEAVLQAIWYGRPIYGPEAIAALRDDADVPLDLTRAFGLDDDPAGAAAFLAVTGFVVLRGVLTPSEVAELGAAVGDVRAEAWPGDALSWWATRANGDEVCCRLTYLARRSPLVAALAHDARLARIAALADASLVPCVDRLDGVSVVIKHPEIVAGLSDLPWHRDCGVGGHPVLCPGLNVGVQLDRADAANGQLHFLAGSHHHAAQVSLPDDIGPLPVVAVETEPGDVTVHFGHTLHAAPPPTSATASRRALYVGFHVPQVFDVVGAGQAYNDVLVARDAGRVKSVDEVVVGGSD